tara:strand:- start:1353 stop:1535 length:183 start_codon:yes stop_codon:yes gene_type:complete
MEKENKQWKSVGIDITTYNKLRKICDQEDRNISQQIKRMVNKEYRDTFKNNDSLGIGSVG